MSTIEEMVEELPLDIQINVKVFVNSLLEKRREHPAQPLSQDWAGGFSEFKSQYSSMELQKKALEWRWDQNLFLVDTNVWLERLLNQERSFEVADFLSEVPSNYLFISDFSLHSIGVIASKLHCIAVFQRFLKDNFINGSVGFTTVLPFRMEYLLLAMQKYNLDFDDAYQLSVIKEYGLTLVSFDHDFDRTPEGRITPSAALLAYRNRKNTKNPQL